MAEVLMLGDGLDSRSFSVLIVDDDQNFRSLIKVLLETTGCLVLEARTGRDADLLLHDNRPSLIIVDYRLPGLDGMQWIAHIREAGWKTPIIFLSGTWFDLKTFTKLRSLLKVSLVLQKPIVPELFLDQIETLLPHYQNSASVQETNLSRANIEIAEPIEAYSEKQSKSLAETDYKLMEAELPAFDMGIEEVPEPDSAFQNQDDLRHLFKDELSGDLPAALANKNALPRDLPNQAPRHKSGEGLPDKSVMPKASFIDSQTALPSHFKDVPLSRDSSEELAIIKSPELEPLEQLARFRQKAKLEETLRQARVDYARILPKTVQSLAANVSALKADPLDAFCLDEVLQAVHQLKGTAGSLGFPHLGKTAAIIEKLLLNNNESTSKESIWPQIDQQVSQCIEIAHANSAAFSAIDTTTQKAFAKKVALLGNNSHFAKLTHELTLENQAEAYLLKDTRALLAEGIDERFNCVIVDAAVLQEQSPIEFLEQARRSIKLRNVPFAFIADNDWRADEALWFYTGAEYILPKEVSLNSLKNAVLSMLTINENDMPRVLTVDDDAVLTGFICNTLSLHRIAASSLNEPIKVLEALQDFAPDLVLLDVVMPGVSGYDICRMIRSHEKYKKMPILFLTSKSSQEGRLAAFRAGADDFLTKPILSEELIARVRSRLETSELLKKRADVNNQTGLNTRQSFLDSLKRLLAKAGQAGDLLTVAIVSIDKFEELALSVGFAEQEKIFKDFANLLQKRFRVEDLRGHWSEGTFILAFPNIEAAIVNEALFFLAGEFAAATEGEHKPESEGKRVLRYGLAEFLTDGVNEDTMLGKALERSMRASPVDVSTLFAIYQEGDRAASSPPSPTAVEIKETSKETIPVKGTEPERRRWYQV